MKPRCTNQRNAAMTLFEVGVVTAVLLVLAVVLLLALSKSRRKSSRIFCVNNLKQIGLACRIWESDNGDIYPMGIPVTNGGSMEMVQLGDVASTFRTMSNELSTPKILICNGDGNNPGDRIHKLAADFDTLSNLNISYFVSVDVTNEANSLLILSGDSHLQIRGKTAKSGLLSIWTNDPVAWDSIRHDGCGNLGFADGSVQSLTASMAMDRFIQTGVATNRLAIP